jgi:hypothetical protein
MFNVRSIVSWVVMLAFFSLGRLFGGQMFPFKVAFFAWSTALGKVILWTILGNDISLWLIGVVYVKLMRVCRSSSTPL